MLHQIIEQNRFGIASDLRRQIRDVTLLRASAGDGQGSDAMNEDVSSPDVCAVLLAFSLLFHNAIQGTAQDGTGNPPYRPGLEEEAFAEALGQLLSVDD